MLRIDEAKLDDSFPDHQFKIKEISSCKQFWNFVKPFLTNKGCMGIDFSSISNRDAFIDKESELVEMFNTHYNNTTEKTSSVPRKNYVIDANNTQVIIE